MVLVPPSPKFQALPAIAPVELSVNVTVSGIVPPVGDALKFAMGGGGLTVMVFCANAETDPSETVRIAV